MDTQLEQIMDTFWTSSLERMIKKVGSDDIIKRVTNCKPVIETLD